MSEEQFWSLGLIQLTWQTTPWLTHMKRPWCWERLKAGGEGDDRGWDGWMASLTQWTWVWVDSGSWWWTGRPGVLRFMGSQRVGYDWVTELTWPDGLAMKILLCQDPLLSFVFPLSESPTALCLISVGDTSPHFLNNFTVLTSTRADEHLND